MKTLSYIIGLLVLVGVAFSAYSRGKQQFIPYATCARNAHVKATTLYTADGKIATEGFRYLWNELVACDNFLPSGFTNSHVPLILPQGSAPAPVDESGSR